MTTFVLIPGAGSAASIWDYVVTELERRGQWAVAVELPCDDPSAALPDYVDAAVAAVGERGADDLVVVGQSLGAFTAAALCGRVPVSLLVFLGAMIPIPGESPGAWWESTRHAEAIRPMLRRHGSPSEWDDAAMQDVFLHDVPEDRLAHSEAALREQTGGIFGSPLVSDVWLTVPTRALLFRDDRLFPAAFERRLARERLGLEAEEMDGGHLAMLSRPAELADRLVGIADATGVPAQPAR